MTLEEFKRLETGSVIYYEGIKFTLDVEKSSIAPTSYYMHNTDSMGNNIQFCLKWPYVKVEFGFNGLVPGNSSVCISKFLSDVIIMHKVLKTNQKENTVTLDSLKKMPNGSIIEYLNEMFEVVNSKETIRLTRVSELSPPIYYIKKHVDNWFAAYMDHEYVCEINETEFLKNLKLIKPKKEESKMKTDFTMPPQTTKEITYPKFMLRKADGIVVLFFNHSSGVVVVSNKNIPMNHFSTTWDWDMFTPVENCSVTFSDKD